MFIRNHNCIIPALIFTLALSFAALGATAQEKKNLLGRIDDYIIRRQQNQPYDTTFFYRPQQKWKIGVSLNEKVNWVHVYGRDENATSFNDHFISDVYPSVGLSASYRSVGATLYLSPFWKPTPGRDINLGARYLGNTWGIEGSIISTDYVHGNSVRNGIRTDFPGGDLSMMAIDVDSYYVFNNKHFSYPAAINQGFIQKRSSGSAFLAAALHVTNQESTQNPRINYHSYNLSLGVGYGYNLVLPHQWLVHASFIPSFVVYGATNHGFRQRRILHNPFESFDLIGTASFSVVHHWDTLYIGLTTTNHGALIGNPKVLSIDTFRHNASVMVGYYF